MNSAFLLFIHASIGKQQVRNNHQISKGYFHVLLMSYLYNITQSVGGGQ